MSKFLLKENISKDRLRESLNKYFPKDKPIEEYIKIIKDIQEDKQ
jgi:uncharacterized protein (DUF2344 family)